MSIPTLTSIVLTGIFAANGVALALYPTLKGPDAFFGVPVSKEYFRSQWVESCRGYGCTLNFARAQAWARPSGGRRLQIRSSRSGRTPPNRPACSPASRGCIV